MGASRGLIITLIGDAVARARIAALLRELTGSPSVCLTPSEVRERLRGGGVRGFVVSAHDRDGRSTAALVGEVRREFPDVSIVAYCEVGRTPSSAMTELVQAGAHQLMLHPNDDSRLGLETLLRNAHRANVANLVFEAIAEAVPPDAHPLVNLYLRGGEGPVPVTEAAMQLGVHRKTLRNRMESAGLPAPVDLRAWCRLFLAARLLDEPGRTVESVALQLDFNTGSALRNLLRRRTGLAPWELRAAGGLAFLIERFAEECAARRRAHGGDVMLGGVMPADREVGLPVVPLPRVAEPPPRGRRRGAAERRMRRGDQERA